MFEVHVALPKLTTAITLETITTLKAAGLLKSKYFLEVYDLPVDGQMQACAPPTGHDLANPGVMTTVKMTSVEEAISKVTAGMKILRDRGIEGNFEVEEIINSTSADITLGLELFPKFQRVPDSPGYENHILWKGIQTRLPSNEVIVELLVKATGVKPHQIVDFGYNEVPTVDSIITRVATIYQPTRKATLSCGLALSSQKDFLGFHHKVDEKVHMVGEWGQ